MPRPQVSWHAGGRPAVGAGSWSGDHHPTGSRRDACTTVWEAAMSSPSACPSPERWQQHLTGTLPAAEQAELTEHLGRCPVCQHTLEALAASDSLLNVAEEVGREPAPAGPAMKQVVDGLKGKATGATSADPTSAEDQPLPFLRPSGKPGCLGRLGHYDVLELVGRGGMGVVFRARDDVLQRVVAIKVLAPQLATSGLARQRFIREARAAAAVSHDHIVTIHAVEEADG